MNNSLKITTDKEEYICNETEQEIIIENINELGLKDIYLSRDSVNGYPIKSLDLEKGTFVIDTSLMENDGQNAFRIFSKIDLPKLIVEDMPRQIVPEETYRIKLYKGDWWKSNHNSASMTLTTYFGEREQIYSTISMYSAVTEETNSYMFIDFKVPKSLVPPTTHTMSLKLRLPSSVRGLYDYLCESEPIQCEILPIKEVEGATGSQTTNQIFLETNEYLFEANKNYTIRPKSTIILDECDVRLNFNYTKLSGGSTTHTFIVKPQNNTISFTMSVLEECNKESLINFNIQAINENNEIIAFTSGNVIYSE